ncbi:MAG: hypothetical protein IPF57_24065 [Gammaproteobacteria bacterium]|nr:hypothetical protein [Gammaproteobacteria bacterium]
MGKGTKGIAIKQAIRFEWMQKAANLLLAGLDAKTIRRELHEFLVDRKGNGSERERSDQTRTFVVNNLMKIWISPDPELIKEQYGDRQTVSRYARFVIRSFVAWGALKDSEAKGCYEKAAPVSIAEPNLAILMFESALLATPEAKGTLGLLLNNPAFFPFQLPVMTGDFVSQRSERIDVVRYGLDDELLKLKDQQNCTYSKNYCRAD